MTAIPATIDGFLELLRAEPDIDNEDVLLADGPWLDRPAEPKVVAIGWLPEEGSTVEWGSTPASLGRSEAETFVLSGLLSVWDGDGDLKAARDAADSLLETVRRVVKSNPKLGGAVSRAQLATVSASQYRTTTGAEYTIQFAIHANVF